MLKKLFLITIVCSSFIFAQDFWESSAIPKMSRQLYTWEAQNDTAIVGEGSALLNGLNLKTKTKNKCLGSSSRQDWMVWWDSTELVTNSTFDNNIYGWVEYLNGTDTFEWLATGGGFNGVLHCVSSNNAGGIVDSSWYDYEDWTIPLGEYRLKYDINITVNTAQVLIVALPAKYQRYIITTGTFSIDTTLTITNDKVYGFNIIQMGEGNVEFYLDNFSCIKLPDSSQTLIKNLQTIEQREYKWYHSLFYTTKGQQGVCVKDTLYSYDLPDSFTTPTNRPTNFVATGDTSHIDLTWNNASYIETGYAIERDTVVGGSGFVAIDTTAINATSYIDNGVIEGGTYRYQMRTIASVNSAYTDIEYATVLEEIVGMPEGTYTSDGNELYTSDGNRLYAKP